MELIIAYISFALSCLTCGGLFVSRKFIKRLERDLINVRADRDSYRNMYGPNPITGMPDTDGTVSEVVLIDIVGKNDPLWFFLVRYNWELKRWEDITDGQPVVCTPGAVWYRLPLKKYEDQRLSR